MQPIKMSDFSALLGDLAQTCQELEQIKAEQTKDHERVSRSFEKTLLAILRQEQSVLSRVEEEHGRLRDRLSSLQRSNTLALQDGVREINTLVQKISSISSQLKQLLQSSGQSWPTVKEIQRQISELFLRKNNLRISLKKVRFTPQPLPATTLGDITCEEQPLGFSTPYLNRKAPSPLLLSDEKPPWDIKSLKPEEFGFVGMKILMEDESDSSSGSSRSSLEMDRGEFADLQVKVSQRGEVTLEMDKVPLCTQQATEKWVSYIKPSPGRLRAVGNTQEAKHRPLPTNQLLRQPPTTIKTRAGAGKIQNPWSTAGLKKERVGQQGRTMPTSPEASHKVETRNPTMQDLRQDGEDQSCIATADHSTLFRATAAYIQEDQSESSEDTIEEDIATEPMRDPHTCRQVALRGSRVPSAKKQSTGDQWTSWMKPPLNHPAKEDPPMSDLERGSPQTSNKTQPGVDYLRMSDEKSDSLNGDFLTIPRAVSLADSVTSTYTFIIENPKNTEISRSGTFRVSTSKMLSNDSGTGHPVISAKSEKTRKSDRPRLVSKTRTQPPQPVLRSSSMPYINRPPSASTRLHRPASAKERRDSASSTSSSWSNPRSVSTSDQSGVLQEVKIRIKSAQYNRKNTKTSREPQRCLSKSECNLSESPPEHGNGGSKLVRQFGKFGSGRAELNLPHGIDISSTGSLYIVDYGNKRLQVMDTRGKLLQQVALEPKNYFDVAVNNRGLVALTNSTDRSVDVYSKHGRLLQVIPRNWGAPRGITANYKDEFVVADMKLGVVCALVLDPTSGRQKESTVLPGFNKPYLVSSNSQGLLAVSERGPDGGCCVKLLRDDWQLLRVLGLKNSPGPHLCNPWGICVDSEGGVLVADWGQKHSIIYYPAKRPAAVLVREGLSSPRGVALWQDALLLVADSMNNCIKAYRYQEPTS